MFSTCRICRERLLHFSYFSEVQYRRCRQASPLTQQIDATLACQVCQLRTRAKRNRDYPVENQRSQTCNFQKRGRKGDGLALNSLARVRARQCYARQAGIQPSFRAALNDWLHALTCAPPRVEESQCPPWIAQHRRKPGVSSPGR